MIYVQIRPKGTRLGNWMFQYAAAKSAFPDDEISFVIDDRNDWQKVEKFRSLFPNVVITDCVPREAKLRTSLYQDIKFLLPDVCRRLYTCPTEISESLERKFGNLLQNNNLVSIHVRRGDYLKLSHRHPFVGETYLKKAIALFEKLSNIEFIVCSDDIPWCKKFFGKKCFKSMKFHFSEENSVLEDLFLMRMCKGGHICSNSTFSWWGAYRNADPQPLTIFPSMWYGLAIHEDWKGMYFDGSEVIENHYTFVGYVKARTLCIKTRIGGFLRHIGLMS